MDAYQRLNIISAIRTAMQNVTPTVYRDDRPSAITSQQNAFAVVKLGDTYNLGAYGDTYATVKLFVRDDSGMERTDLLSDMESKAYKELPINNALFYTQKPHTLQSKSDGNGFHYITIYFDLILK